MGMQYWARLLLLVSFATVSAGCGGATKTVKTSGILTLDGKPLQGATVIFQPIADGDAANSHSANAITDASGEFELTTYNTHDGALPGTYKVIVQLEKEDPNRGSVQLENMDPSAYHQRRKAESTKAEAKKDSGSNSLVPANYTSADKTPLKFTIPASGKIELRLTKTGT